MAGDTPCIDFCLFHTFTITFVQYIHSYPFADASLHFLHCFLRSEGNWIIVKGLWQHDFLISDISEGCFLPHPLFNPHPHILLFILNRYWQWGASVIHAPNPPTNCFSAESCARIFGTLLLVDGRALRVSSAYKCKVWFLSKDESPSVGGSHFSSFLHILPLKQYSGWISMKSMKRQIILQ